MSDMWREIVPDASADRYAGIIRPYTSDEVQKLRGSIAIAHTLAHRGLTASGDCSSGVITFMH